MTHDDETIEAGVRRIAGEQIDKAINELNDDNLERHEAVHQVRKRCKKIRGLVRLARTSFERTYQFENAWFRDTASQFSYVNKLNELIPNTEFETATLEEIIQNASGGIFNNGAQVWNHTFYWNCMSPEGGGEPQGALAQAIEASFGNFVEFKDHFSKAAATNFGSGWTWLVRNSDGGIEIVNTSNAGNPMTDGKLPLLTCDVWEHAYYIDYRNARPKYVEAFWNIVNWNFVMQNLGG